MAERALALVDLARDPHLVTGDLPGFLQAVVTRAAATLGVDRVAVWLYDEARTAIRCAALAERGTPRVAVGCVLQARDHPSYFSALEDARVIDAPDAWHDTRTRELRRTYLEPAGVGAMLDAPVRSRGRVVGVVCHEHEGTPRRWRPDDMRFASSVADLVALGLASCERQHAEAAAREAERRYRALLDGSFDIFYVLTPEGRIVALNRAFRQILGWPAEAWLGRHFVDIVHPEDVPAAMDLFRRALVSDTVQPSEIRVRHADGSWRVGEFSIGLQRRDGAPVELLGVARDVTARLDTERRLRGLVDVSRAAASTLDLDRALDRLLAELTALLPCDAAAVMTRDPVTGAMGLSAQRGLEPAVVAALSRDGIPVEVLDRDLLRTGTVLIYDPAHTSEAAGAFMESLGLRSAVAVGFGAHGGYEGALVAAWRTPGAARPLEVQLCETVAHQVAGALGTIALYQALQRDVRVRRALGRIAGALLESVELDVVVDRLCTVTRETLHADASRTWLRCSPENRFELTGEAADRQLSGGLPGVVLLPVEAFAGLLARLQREPFVELTADEAAACLPPTLCRAAGHRRTLVIALRHGAELVGVQVLGRREDRPFDEEDRRIARELAQIAALAIENARLVERLEEIDRLRSDLMAAMSHELRTPVNVVVGYADLLLEGAFGELAGDVRDAIGRLGETARQLGRLVAMALDLSHLQAGRLAVAWGDVDLRELVREVVEELRAAGGKGVPVKLTIPPDVPPLRTDREKLQVVLQNLVGNALKFTERGNVAVSVAASGHETTITVRDTGPGIPPEERDVIFEAFRQGRAGRGRGEGGAGLGLHIVRRLVQLLGGSVGVEDVADGGAMFTVRLPHRG